MEKPKSKKRRTRGERAVDAALQTIHGVKASLTERAVLALKSEQYEDALNFAYKCHSAYGCEKCHSIMERIKGAPWSDWRPEKKIQKTQLTKIHRRQVTWMLVSKRMGVYKNVALIICAYISTINCVQ